MARARNWERLRSIKTIEELLVYLREELDWPLQGIDVEDVAFEYTPEELGLDHSAAAKIDRIHRLRPMSANQPWGIFFVDFEPKNLPVTALRRILGRVVLKKRAKGSAQAWQADDLLFISTYGQGPSRQICLAHFSASAGARDLPTLKVLGWDEQDTALHLAHAANTLVERLTWPDDEKDLERWRRTWSAAFTLGHREVISTAKDLSFRLAALARAIRLRITTALAIESESGPLTRLMHAFREVLVHDLTVESFADMYAQTIAYGLLSARITDPHKKTADDFAGHLRTNPFLRELMETFLKVGGRQGKAGGSGIDFDELGVSDVVELLDDANMEAVVRDFGDRNPQEDPVIHFYEHFLAAYDKQQKVSRGVFYTPRPVVSYIVRSVDELLRTEFGLEDGLADTTTWGEMLKRQPDMRLPNLSEDSAHPRLLDPEHPFVQILDPATGTGTFLVEVIEIIHQTMTAKWTAQGQNAKQIEALWNDYVPRHLLPRLHGYELLMAPYAIAHLKIGLKLHETGYLFGSEERARIYLTNALEPASDKQVTTAMLPALAHEAQAVNAIKRDQRFTVIVGNPPYAVSSSNWSDWIRKEIEEYKRGLNERRINLDDDFIKFFRLCQINADQSLNGIVGLITNFTYIDGRTHRKMREGLLSTFNNCWILNLNGDVKRPHIMANSSGDKNVFDIQQGTAIFLGIKNYKDNVVKYSELVTSRENKYSILLSNTYKDIEFEVIFPKREYFYLVPCDQNVDAEYSKFHSIEDLFLFRGACIGTERDDLCIQWSFDEMKKVIDDFAKLDVDHLRTDYELYDDSRDWTVSGAKKDVMSHDADISLIRRINYRPFDMRYTFYSGKARGFLGTPSAPGSNNMVDKDNIAIICCRQQSVPGFRHVWISSTIAERCLVSNRTREGCSIFPLLIGQNRQLIGDGFDLNVNCNELTHYYDSSETNVGVHLFYYIYSILNSPNFRTRYEAQLSKEYPRIPLTSSHELFNALSKIGIRLASLHLLDASFIASNITSFTGPSLPEVGRVGWADRTVWLDAATTKKGQPATPGSMGFRGVPEEVWNFHIGGYQVCEKWLKDRKGRRLSDEDIAHYQKIVVALSETIRLMGEIDEVIEKHGGWPGAFATGPAAGADYPAEAEDLPKAAETGSLFGEED
jgi:hypothetical protein